MINLGILISGRGSNMEAILRAIERSSIKYVIPRVVISNKPDAPGLHKAAEMGIPTKVVQNSSLGWDYDKEMVNVLKEHMVNPQNGLVCLAGYMRIMSAEFIKLFNRRILNIHPSLLPSFPGLHAQKQALEYGVKVSGCTVHFVQEGVDTGPIIAQKTIDLQDNDTEETLSTKILEHEHELYVECINLFAEGRLSIRGRRVFLST
ncbi:MAG: phosphoribosylglycinamide formyltransferase [Thermoproteota archaeon]|nr:phosphoribosylglycinamide formyltransferase [Thermoproteota archaeon]